MRCFCFHFAGVKNRPFASRVSFLNGTEPKPHGEFNVFIEAPRHRTQNSLDGVFEGPVKLEKAQVGREVQQRFLEAMQGGYPILPTFHGSNERTRRAKKRHETGRETNYRSILERGLLIPGRGNELRVANGSAHGLGIYTANVTNPRLSMGFCTAPKMLVCGVLDDATVAGRAATCGNFTVKAQSNVIKHVGDAVVVFDESRVVPLWQASAQSFRGHSWRPTPGGAAATPGKVYHARTRQVAFMPPVAEDNRDAILQKRIFEKKARELRMKSRRQEKSDRPEKLREVAGGGGPAGAAAVTAYLQEEAQKAFYRKLELIEGAGPGLTAMVTRQVLLMQLDTFWQQHLKNMDFMKSGMTLRAYGQKNPLTEYKLEGYQVFLKMMSKIRRNALYNVFLFQPRKLTLSSIQRVFEREDAHVPRAGQGTDPQPRDAAAPGGRDQEVRELQGGKGSERHHHGQGRCSSQHELGEALVERAASPGSTRRLGRAGSGDTFARSGLLTLGDQLMWAQACSEFELLEDELAGEVYIGLVGRMEPQAAKAPPETNLEDMDIERFEERQREAQKLFESAQEDPNFVQTLAAFSNEPELFLKELKAASQEQGWTREDVKKMKERTEKLSPHRASKLQETYAMMGINLEVMLQEMQASADALPPAQRDLVAYMQQMLTDPDSVLQKAEDKAEKRCSAPMAVSLRRWTAWLCSRLPRAYGLAGFVLCCVLPCRCLEPSPKQSQQDLGSRKVLLLGFDGAGKSAFLWLAEHPTATQLPVRCPGW
eukprot:g292.t1